MPNQDYYQILGVQKDDDAARLKEAYREMALKYHPDRNADNPAHAEKMKAINEAYAVLSNTEKRREYDALKNQFGSSAYSHFRNSYSDQDIFNGSDVHQVFEEMARAFGVRGFDEIFKGIYGQQGFRTFQRRGPGFFAGGFVFGGPRGGKGSGRMRGQRQPGIGRIAKMLLSGMVAAGFPRAGADIHESIYLDADFAAKGGPYAYYLKQRKKKLVVKIPPNVRNGRQIRLKGMGKPGIGGGAPGDLYLKTILRTPVLKKLKNAFKTITGK